VRVPGRGAATSRTCAPSRLLLANCLAQSEALMKGRTLEEARAMLAKGMTGGESTDRAAPRLPGNRPST
jgi:glucose-6-phosphate isomerase